MAEAAVAIVHARGPVESVLLIRRAERAGDPWSGHWSFPGGRCDRADADLLHTALRELEEECAIRLPRESLHEAMPERAAGRRTGAKIVVAPFVLTVERTLPAVPDEREAVEALWVPLEKLRDRCLHRLSPVPGMPDDMWFPGIGMGSVPLWGFTYHLITDWLGLNRNGQPSERTGFQAACRVVEFLAGRGVEVESGWTALLENHEPVAVKGPIPAEDVLAHFSAPGIDLAGINRLEVHADRIRLAGPAFEEYVIRTQES